MWQIVILYGPGGVSNITRVKRYKYILHIMTLLMCLCKSHTAFMMMFAATYQIIVAEVFKHFRCLKRYKKGSKGTYCRWQISVL